MKLIENGNKVFKVIPEGKRVEGYLLSKWVGSDLKEGIKPIYKKIIKPLAEELTILNMNDGSFYYNNDEETLVPIINGKSLCDSHDEFSEKIGIDVCAAKMELKNHVKLAILYSRMHKLLVETAIIVDAWCIKHHEKAKAIEDDLINYYGRDKS